MSTLGLCILLTSQVVLAAEQRSLLRAGRAGEPLITLPQSLLLQSTDGEETGDEVVDRARLAYFADDQAKAAAAQKVFATTTAAPVMTTQDPSVVAKAMNISLAAAQGRNMLVSMISRAQIGLLTRLEEINMDLDATELRAKQDLKAVNLSFIAAKTMPIMASNAEVDVAKIAENGKNLKAVLPKLVLRANASTIKIAKFMKIKQNLMKDLDKTKTLPGAKRRVQANQATMNSLYPRLETLEKHVTKLEAHLYDGDLKKMVDDATGKEVVDLMEDVSRGFGRFFKNEE